jgi:two-component sensor histidine kinase/sensor domain CHASE-containing protein
MRRRILLVISGTLVVMMGFLFTVTQTLLSDSYSRLERRYVERDLERVFNAIDAELKVLGGTVSDWASWDETYGFAESLDPAYVASNIDLPFFQNLDLNVVICLDPRGRIILAKSFDLASRQQGDVSDALRFWMAAHPAFSRLTSVRGGAQGAIQLPEGTLLAVSRPILSSLGFGPVHGTLVMGRFLDNHEAAHLADQLRISLALIPLGAPGTPAKATDAARSVAPGGPPLLDTSDEDVVTAYSVVRDVDGNPAVALRVDAPRDIHRQGQETMRYFYLWFLVIGVVFCGVVIIFIEWQIVSRLLGLSADVLAAGTGGGPRHRVRARGKDQIAYLGAAINGMLEARDRSTEELRRSERRNEAFLDAIPDVIFRITRDGTILDARSPTKAPLIEASKNLVGKDSEQIIALYPFISPEQYSRSMEATEKALDSGEPQVLEYRASVEGARRHFEERFVASGENEVIVLIREVTALKIAEEARDKEVLLKEIHHRVKNNLQVISSLLALQAGSTRDARTKALLGESRDRVRSMALIHEKLYQSGGDERGMSLKSYVGDLAAHLRHSYAGNSEAVEIAVDVEDVTVSMDASVPCGLIVNELLTNALKYAFPDGRRGTIHVRLRRAADGMLVLTISDDGVGLPPGFDVHNPETLGLRIVNILVQQLKGTLALDATPGASITITFPWA